MGSVGSFKGVWLLVGTRLGSVGDFEQNGLMGAECGVGMTMEGGGEVWRLLQEARPEAWSSGCG